jgi:hypothetical protein
MTDKMRNQPGTRSPEPETNDFVSFGVQTIHGQNEAFTALFTTDSKRVFDYEDVRPVEVKKGFRGYVPWGTDNEQPYLVLEKIRDDEVMSSNMWFNITCAYGRGFQATEDGEPVLSKNYKNEEVKKFFRRNNMIKFWAEQFTDIKHFQFSVLVVIVDAEGNKIVQVRHKEAINCRFETCNDDGDIEHIFYADWKKNPKDEEVDAFPLLDLDDPVGDLMVRLGKEEDPTTGKKLATVKDRIFAIVNKIPTAGEKYYPFPYYAATFNSGWFDIKQMVPTAKKAKMRNGMFLRFIIYLHKDYFTKLYEAEKITDPKKKKERQTLEMNNIKNFLANEENAGKQWTSSYYIDPNGKEVNMVKIERIDKDKEGGDWIEDSEEAANIVSYAMGVHPSLIGSSPGANKSINGTEARELFTMKQALEKLPRDIMLQPFYMLNDVNGWNLEFDIPDLMLTTLDQKTDAKVVSQASTNSPEGDGKKKEKDEK